MSTHSAGQVISIRYVINSLPLLAGGYIVQVALEDVTGHSYDHIAPAASFQPRPSTMPGAPCSKRRRDSPFTRSDIHNSLMRPAGNSTTAPQRPCPIGDPGVCHYTRHIRAATRAQIGSNRQPWRSIKFMSVVRLEYRNVTMRFTKQGFSRTPTAISGRLCTTAPSGIWMSPRQRRPLPRVYIAR